MAEIDSAYMDKMLQVQRNWYYPELSKQEAYSLLLTRGYSGHFLIRRGHSEPGTYSLCVRKETDVAVVKIYNDGDHYTVPMDRGAGEFCSLLDIIYCYTVEGNQLKEKTGKVIKLTMPLVRDNVYSWYHGRILQSIAEKLLKNNGTQNCFLIRDKSSNFNEFVLCALVSQSCVKNYIIMCKEEAQKNIYYLETQGHTKSSFKDLASLVEHYRRNAFKDQINNRDVDIRLGQPVEKEPLSSNIATKILATPVIATISDEFEWLRQQENLNKASQAYGERPENKTRNRFKNILPFDHTRVVLKDANPDIPGDDYINANYILSGTRKAYIACQGSLATTKPAFWRMIWQDNVHVIAMVTELVEMGKNKCARYWPKVKDTEVFEAFGYRLRVTAVEEKSPNRDYTVRKFVLARENQTDNIDQYVEAGSRDIYHFQYHAWPDKSVPQQPSSLLTFLSKAHERHVSERSTGPIVVHCSAGIGRTGTFIVVGLIIEKLKRNIEADISIMNVVSEVRGQRPGMVQTEVQYKFIYSLIDCYRKSLGKPANDQILYENINPNAAQTDLYENLKG